MAALTARRLRILGLIADGKSNAQIGAELFITEETVKTHVRRLFKLLGAVNRAHAVRLGFDRGFLSTEPGAAQRRIVRVALVLDEYAGVREAAPPTSRVVSLYDRVKTALTGRLP